MAKEQYEIKFYERPGGEIFLEFEDYGHNVYENTIFEIGDREDISNDDWDELALLEDEFNDLSWEHRAILYKWVDDYNRGLDSIIDEIKRIIELTDEEAEDEYDTWD